MKKIKLLASLLAVGAVSTMFAAASFADDTYTANANYTAGADGAAATVVVSGIDSYTADNTVGDYTIVILNKDALNVTDADLVYVMQGTKEEISTAKFANLTDGKYYVRIGGASTGYVSGSFTVGGTVDPEPDPDPNNPYADSTLLVGDVNASKVVDAGDLSDLVYHLASVDGYIIQSGNEKFAAADVNDSGVVDAGDLSDLVYYLANKTAYPFPYEYVKDKQNNKNL